MENQLVVGKYAKSKVNKNGNLPIEFCELYNLLITNTIFKNKPSHQTTWISPLSPTFSSTRSFNVSKFQNTQVAENYMKQVNEIIKTQTSTTSNQEEWNNIVKALKASAEKNLGYNHQGKKSRDPKIMYLSSIQKDINIKLNSIKDEQKKKLLKKERNKY